jgi:hypothetical protein
MINAEVIFCDDYIICNKKNIWFHPDSSCFVVGKYDDDHEDGGEIDEFSASLEKAITYCLEQAQ